MGRVSGVDGGGVCKLKGSQWGGRPQKFSIQLNSDYFYSF